MLQSRHMDSPLVIFDVETTGMRPDAGHEIVEIAAQKILADRVLDEFYALVKASRPLDEEVMRVHGITDALLAAEGKIAKEVFPAFLEFAGEHTLVGHNIGFDIAFVNAHLKRLGLPSLTNPTIDTIGIAKRYLILPSYALGKVAQYMKIPQTEAHRAKADVETTRQVFLKLLERAQNGG